MLVDEDRRIFRVDSGVEEREWASLCHGEGRRGISEVSLGGVGVDMAMGDMSGSPSAVFVCLAVARC